MTNENERGFAISCDGLWVTGFVEAGGRQRWVLGIEEERVIYPADCAFLLCFPDAEEMAEAEKWAERMEDTFTQYILDAITDYNQKWREHAGYEVRRAEQVEREQAAKDAYSEFEARHEVLP